MDNFIPTADAAEIAGMSLEHVRRLARIGTVESKKFGYFTMISKPSLMAYLKTDRSQKAVAQRRKKRGE